MTRPRAALPVISTVESDEDLAAWVQLNNEVWPHHPTSVADRRRTIDRAERKPILMLARDGRDGRATGLGSAFASSLPSERDVVWVAVASADPTASFDLEHMIFARLRTWSLSGGFRIARAGTRANLPTALLYPRLGFHEVERMHAMKLALDELSTLPDVSLTDGVHLATIGDRPDLVRSLYDVMAQVTADIPSRTRAEMPQYETWHAQLLEDDGVTQIAIVDDSVVGCSQVVVSKDVDADTGYNGMTGVLPAWRRKGIALALKVAATRWARDHGLNQLQTLNHDANAPMLHINRRIGYRDLPDSITYERSLD